MSEINKNGASDEYYVCTCEHTLLHVYREKRWFSVKYNHTKGKTKGKAGAGMWKKK